jgi:hypothetical protein
VEGVNSSVIYLIYCKNFYKRHNALPPSTTIKINKYSTSLVIKETTIKTALRFHLTPVRKHQEEKPQMPVRMWERNAHTLLVGM